MNTSNKKLARAANIRFYICIILFFVNLNVACYFNVAFSQWIAILMLILAYINAKMYQMHNEPKGKESGKD